MDEMRAARGNWEKTERLPSGTKRGIKSRHAQMIALGGSIGTGFFLSTGEALFVGGPAFLLLAFALSSILVYGILTAIVEIGVYLPVEGASMAYYVSRMLSRSLGFALGWLYFYSFGILVAFEITAAAIIIDYWPNDVPLAAWITILLVVIIVLNMSPVAVYAESEFWFAGLKIMLIVGLLIVSLAIVLGGGPSHDRIVKLRRRDGAPRMLPRKKGKEFGGWIAYYASVAWDIENELKITMTNIEAGLLHSSRR